jgi:hypothetical protein
MNVGDIATVKLKLQSNGVYVKAIEKEWLKYLGFSDEEIEGGEIELVFKAEISDHKKFNYIGFGKSSGKK